SPFLPGQIAFEPDISSWDVSNVTNMSHMFGTKEIVIYIRVNFN
ncbi:MAG: BspA family leucine-rich repeat surface protein, partial [Flavobacteriaceae bacterium]|nr:BspA family leucine-rich repeat surface protein [Flavobacteriaceae bacterium]